MQNSLGVFSEKQFPRSLSASAFLWLRDLVRKCKGGWAGGDSLWPCRTSTLIGLPPPQTAQTACRQSGVGRFVESSCVYTLQYGSADSGPQKPSKENGARAFRISVSKLVTDTDILVPSKRYRTKMGCFLVRLNTLIRYRSKLASSIGLALYFVAIQPNVA